LKNLLKFLLAVCFTVAAPFASQSQSQQLQPLSPLPSQWVAEEIRDGSVPAGIVPNKLKKAKNGLPDGRVATGSGDIIEAWYSEPTTRYAHAVLGDRIEAGALKIRNARKETYTYRLPSTEVFEDITPRLADLDGNGTTEVITILSSQSGGASIAVFGLNGNAFLKLAQTPFIGQANRWLNIAEIANFTGSSTPEISAVITPHLAGILQFYKFGNGTLTRVAQANGNYSNHFIGSNELRLSTTADVNNDRLPDLILPSLARNELLFVGREGNRMVELGRVSLPARINRPIGKRTNNGKTEFLVGLDNGRIFAIRNN